MLGEIIRVQPDVVIILGEHPGRAMITCERVATNINDSSRYGLADNNGIVLNGQSTAIAVNAPFAYYSTLPIKAIPVVQGIREKGIPADISDSAGTFCCNHLFFGILHWFATATATDTGAHTDTNTESENKNRAVKAKAIKAGWMHLPLLPVTASLKENLGQPSMSAETALAGLNAAVAAVAGAANFVGGDGDGDINININDIDDVSFFRLQV